MFCLLTKKLYCQMKWKYICTEFLSISQNCPHIFNKNLYIMIFNSNISLVWKLNSDTVWYRHRQLLKNILCNLWWFFLYTQKSSPLLQTSYYVIWIIYLFIIKCVWLCISLPCRLTWIRIYLPKGVKSTLRKQYVECKGWYIASSALQTMGMTAVELGVVVT